MEYLKQENNALRKELTDLLHLTIETNAFLQMVLEDLEKHGEKDDANYVSLLIESSNIKIHKLKSLIT